MADVTAADENTQLHIFASVSEKLDVVIGSWDGKVYTHIIASTKMYPKRTKEGWKKGWWSLGLWWCWQAWWNLPNPLSM